MELRLDREACQGHGRCYSLAPHLFEADDDGFAVLLVAEISEERLDEARTAVNSCPERAITLD